MIQSETKEHVNNCIEIVQEHIPVVVMFDGLCDHIVTSIFVGNSRVCYM